MPRKSNDEVIADLEAKLELARSKAVDRRKTEIKQINDKITVLQEREQKISAQILKLEEQRDALIHEDKAAIYSSHTLDEVGNDQPVNAGA